jgi:hypothetical protein
MPTVNSIMLTALPAFRELNTSYTSGFNTHMCHEWHNVTRKMAHEAFRDKANYKTVLF